MGLQVTARDGIGPNLSLDRARSTLQIPPGIRLDLYTDDQAGEIERLLALGVTEVHGDQRQPDADYVILADPEGNRFCVVDIGWSSPPRDGPGAGRPRSGRPARQHPRVSNHEEQVVDLVRCEDGRRRRRQS